MKVVEILEKIVKIHRLKKFFFSFACIKCLKLTLKHGMILALM